jgi:ATP-dependent Clp protease protease subunit
MRTWYNFKAKSEDVADLSIFDYIGYYGVEAAQFQADLAKITASTINVSINSPGGDVFQAVAILNMLRGCGKTINTQVLGIAASAASYIMLAGDKRSMPENTMQMLHNASVGAYGNAAELGELVEVLNKVDANLHATFATRTGLSAERVAELLSKDNYLTAAECLELGLCDEVTPAIKVTAATFDTDRLPENVRALFKAEQPAAEITPFVAQVQEAVAAAGLGDLAEVFALDVSLTTIEQVQVALAEAREVKALCDFLKVDAAAHIRARKTLGDVRRELCDARAAADEALHIDTAPKASHIQQPVQGAVTTASIWAARRK